MNKKISIKTLYLLFLISFGLVGLAVGSTYAMFVATAEINNPITIASNLSYNSDILDIIEIDIEPDETIISTLNIKNSTSNNLNYTAWYIDGGNDIVAGINSGSSTGSLAAGNNTSIEVEIRNESTKKVKVTLGVTSNSDNIVIGEEMKIIPNVRISSTMAEGSSWYTSSVDKSTITKISFAENYTVTGNETETWPAAVDKNNDGTNDSDIMCYLNGTEITIVGTGRIFANANSNDMFREFRNITSIDNLSSLDTSKSKTMGGMFIACNSLTSLDLSNFNTNNVTNMDFMFSGCNSLTTLDLSNFNTSRVKVMQFMFNGCYGLIELDLSGFDTSSVYNMQGMFKNMSLTSLDLSNFDTSSLTTVNGMFTYSKNLQTIDLRNATFENVLIYENMFYDVPSGDTGVNIIIDSTQEEWFNTNFPEYTNLTLITNS